MLKIIIETIENLGSIKENFKIDISSGASVQSEKRPKEVLII
jgi:hypothetical protein